MKVPIVLSRIALALRAVVAFAPRSSKGSRHASPSWLETADLKRAVDQEDFPIVIDVRGRDEFHGPLGRIAVACNIPLPELPGRVAELEPMRDRKLVLVCRTDRRSAQAAELLRTAGFSNVAVLRGGMEQWNREGFAVAR